jgi:BMFP domain-containing protein YqiC
VAEWAASPYFGAEREELAMQSENRVFDDFVKMVNGFAGTFAGMGREAEASAREKFREWMGGTDFVGRDEFEAVKAMAAAARDENEVLKGRIAALEAGLAGTGSATSGAKRTSGGRKTKPGAPS